MQDCQLNMVGLQQDTNHSGACISFMVVCALGLAMVNKGGKVLSLKSNI
jgi:hypothetical protein